MDTFSFEGVFSKGGNFFSKNLGSVLLTGLLMFALMFAADLFIGKAGLDSLDRIQRGSFASEYADFSADPDASAVPMPAGNPFSSRIKELVRLNIILKILPSVFSSVISFCLLALFLPACRGEKLKLINIIPPGFPFLRYLVFITALFGLPLLLIFLFIRLITSFMLSLSPAFIFLFPVLMLLVVVFYMFFALRFCLVPLGFLDNVKFIDSFKQSFILTKGNVFKIFALVLSFGVINFLGSIIIIGRIFTVPFATLVLIYAYLELTAMPEDEPEAKKPVMGVLEMEAAARKAEKIQSDIIK